MFKLGKDIFQFLELIFTPSLCKMVLLSEHYPTSHLCPIVGTFSKSSQRVRHRQQTEIGNRKTIVSQFCSNFVYKKNQEKGRSFLTSRHLFVVKSKLYIPSTLNISITSLLTHTVTHSTRHSFRLKTNNQPTKKFLSLAFS